MQGLLDGIPVGLREQHGIAALAADLHRLMGIADLIDEGMEPLAGLCRENLVDQSRATGAYAKSYRWRTW